MRNFENFIKIAYQNFKSPEELYKYINSNISYDDTPPDKWRLKTPEIVKETRKGNCHDQAQFLKYELDKMGRKNGTLSFIEYNKKSNKGGRTHSLSYYKDGRKVYWLENAWGDQQGIHGPYRSLRKLKSEIKKIHKREPQAKEYNKIKFWQPYPKSGMTLNEYVETMNRKHQK